MSEMPQEKGSQEKKCARCGSEINPDGSCVKCGPDKKQTQDVEIEFKNFKISELLDIRVHAHKDNKEKSDKREDKKK